MRVEKVERAKKGSGNYVRGRGRVHKRRERAKKAQHEKGGKGVGVYWREGKREQKTKGGRKGQRKPIVTSPGHACPLIFVPLLVHFL